MAIRRALPLTLPLLLLAGCVDYSQPARYRTDDGTICDTTCDEVSDSCEHFLECTRPPPGRGCTTLGMPDGTPCWAVDRAGNNLIHRYGTNAAALVEGCDNGGDWCNFQVVGDFADSITYLLVCSPDDPSPPLPLRCVGGIYYWLGECFDSTEAICCDERRFLRTDFPGGCPPLEDAG